MMLAIRHMCRPAVRAVNILQPTAGRIPVQAATSSSASNPDQPDFNTDVNIHQHKLQRPTRAPNQRPVGNLRWDALSKLGENTQGSLIPETLKQMETDEDFKMTASKLRSMGQKAMTREERKQRQRALDNLRIPNFLDFYKETRAQKGLPEKERLLRKKSIATVCINIGLYCNQACSHCHVESSPKRSEVMTRETADRCLEVIGASPKIKLIDLTGGAPELCPEFRHLVTGMRSHGKKVIDRCNLTSLLEPGQEDTIDFLVANKVLVVASMPCYSSKNVNQQRGKGVFAKSIQALLLLNEAGYGQPGSGLHMHLVYNPLGAYLPPPQKELEAQYKKNLAEDFGVVFNELYTMVNMPIKRFNDFLHRRSELETYMEMLVRNYNVTAVDEMMCRDGVTVNWDGQIHDCDFNGQLQIGMNSLGGSDSPADALSVWDIDSMNQLEDHVVRNDNHCFGCSAGMGSS